MINKRNFDYSVIISLIMGIILILAAILYAGNLASFFDFSSVLIVIGGTITVTIASFSYNEFTEAIKLAFTEVRYKSKSIGDAAYFAIKIADNVYKSSVLAIGEQYPTLKNHDEFFAEGIMLIADNVANDKLEKFISQNTIYQSEQFRNSINLFRKASEISPAMGLLGTLIGLVQMFSNFDNIQMIGPAMAIALLTTFYGTIFAYLLLMPVANKIERNVNNELMVKKIYLETLLSINNKENPRILEMNLNNILPTKHHISYF